MIPIIILISCISIIIIYAFRRNSNFIDIRPLLKEYKLLFCDDKYSILVFIYIPYLLAMSITFISLIDKSQTEMLGVISSVIVSMLFALLALLFIKEDISLKGVQLQKYNNVKHSTINTIVYEISISIFLLLLLYLSVFIDFKSEDVILYIYTFITYTLIFKLTFNLFILVKRIYKLYSAKIQNDD